MSADTTYVHATFAVAGTPSPILTLTKLELCLQSTSAIVSAGDYSVAPGHECARVHVRLPLMDFGMVLARVTRDWADARVTAQITG